MTGATAELPLVSVVVPMLDEREAIGDCLDAFAGQSYPLDRLEVLLVDGGSTDGSRELVTRLAEDRPWVRVLDNPRRKASAAFNVGADAAKGDIVCLFSAHGVPDPDYVAASVEALRDAEYAGVGGRYLHVGVDPVSNAIGLAMVSPFGMASPHRFASHRQEVDTISHPAYRRAALHDVGPFDESLERNSDYELNWRLREMGHRLLFDPAVESIYRPRRSLSALARQFWWYGRWKVRVAERHPRSLRPRHLVAPAFALGVALSPVLTTRRGGRRLLVLAAAGYAGVVVAGVRQARPEEHDASAMTLAACFPVMHLSWGSGFLASVVEDGWRRARRGRSR